MPMNTNGGMLINSPYGTARDLDVSKQLALLRALQAQADQEELKTKLADPLQKAKMDASVRQFETRKNVAPMDFAETRIPELPTRNIQRVSTSDSTSDLPTRAIQRLGTGRAFIDPDAAMGAAAKARLDPRVMAEQVQAEAKTGRILDAVPGVGGDAALEGQSEQAKNIVKLLAEYKMSLPSGMALRTPEWQNYLSLAKAYDPSFDATQYGARQKLRTDFTSGKGSQNIRSLNTVVGHLDTLKQKADALKNYSVPLANTVRNFLKTETGNPSIVEFNNAANAVESELATAFKGTGATDQEIKAWRANLGAAQSPDQLHGAIETAIELLGSRLDAMKNQWQVGMGKPSDFEILTPKSQGIIDALKRGGATPASAVPSGRRVGLFTVEEQ